MAQRLGVLTQSQLADDEHAKNNLPDVLARWLRRDEGERENSTQLNSSNIRIHLRPLGHSGIEIRHGQKFVGASEIIFRLGVWVVPGGGVGFAFAFDAILTKIRLA